MRMHFIGLGERIMGDLATALNAQGHTVTGSDETIPDSTWQRLACSKLAPEQPGWFPKKLKQNLDKVVVGRNIEVDNPELKAAQQLKLPIYSYPQYIYEYAKDKQRIVITGGEEKTLLCSLALHVLKHLQKAHDYVVNTPTLSTSVQLSDAPVILLEGDEAPSSPIDLQPQSLHYQHNIILLSGTGWKEASEIYPTLETYLQYVTSLANASPKGGTLIYSQEDKHIKAIGSQTRTDVKAEHYQVHPHRHQGKQTYLVTPQGDIAFPYTDLTSMRAVAGAQQLVHNLAINDQQFYAALSAVKHTIT